MRGRLLKLKKMRQISKQLAEEMLHEVTVNWNLVRSVQENDSRYVWIEFIHLCGPMELLTNKSSQWIFLIKEHLPTEWSDHLKIYPLNYVIYDTKPISNLVFLCTLPGKINDSVVGYSWDRTWLIYWYAYTFSILAPSRVNMSMFYAWAFKNWNILVHSYSIKLADENHKISVSLFDIQV